MAQDTQNPKVEVSACLKFASFVNRRPLLARKWPNTARWVSFAVACFVMSTSGSSFFTFFAWQNSMRAILNQTETESNVVAAFGLCGFSLSFPAGVIYDYFGSQFVTLIGGIVLSLSYAFLWLGTAGDEKWRDWFAENPAIVYGLYFLVGMGGAFAYMAALLPNASNFSSRNRGMIFGMLDAAFILGPAVFSIVYNVAFANDSLEVGMEANQNLSGFFLASAVIMIVSCVAALLFVGQIDISTLINSDDVPGPLFRVGSSESLPIISKNDEHYDFPENEFADIPFEEMKPPQLLTRWSYIYLALQYTLNAAVQEVWRNNIPTYLRSFNLSKYDLTVTVLTTILAVPSHVVGGYASDKASEKGIPRAVVLLIPYAVQTFFYFLSAVCGGELAVIMLTAISYSLATGVTWSLSATILSELYGTTNLGSNWGFTMMLTIFFVFPLSLGFSAIYEAAIVQPKEMYCYGISCFSWSFVLFGGVSLAAIIIVIALIRNMRANAVYRRYVQTISSPTPASEPAD